MIANFEEPLGPTGRLFEQELHQNLHQFLQSMKEIDARLPDFPSASLGWMMYIGMAVAKFFAVQSGKAERWDAEWEIYSKIDDPYAYMKDKRG